MLSSMSIDGPAGGEVDGFGAAFGSSKSERSQSSPVFAGAAGFGAAGVCARAGIPAEGVAAGVVLDGVAIGIPGTVVAPDGFGDSEAAPAAMG